MNKKIKAVYRSVWLAQDKKCASCGKSVPIEETGNHANSLDVVCLKCFHKPQTTVVIDELLGIDGVLDGFLADAQQPMRLNHTFGGLIANCGKNKMNEKPITLQEYIKLLEKLKIKYGGDIPVMHLSDTILPADPPVYYPKLGFYKKPFIGLE